ncbi:MAG: DUF1826 domain-containing protein [Pseudomonadota bacterium]
MLASQGTVARISCDSAILASILEEDCSLAIWERTPPPDLQSLLETDPADIRFVASVEAIEPSLQDALDGAGYAASTASDRLAQDICELTRLYCQTLAISDVEVRLECVTTNSCRKWHSDYVSARLITTYLGDGTDWLDEDDLARLEAGAEPTHIRSLATGDVGLFKGKLAAGKPAIHRSPPIAGIGQKRLLLVLNPKRDVIEG